MLDLYKQILNDEISEEELFYMKLKQQNEKIIDFSLKIKRNKTQYPSLITIKEDIENADMLYCVNSYSSSIIERSLKGLDKTLIKQSLEMAYDYINVVISIETMTVIVSPYMCSFYDKEDAEKIYKKFNNRLESK